MGGEISKNLRWDGSIIIGPRAIDLLKFFVPREGLRVSGTFAAALPWVVYTHSAACRRVSADCFGLRRALPERRLRKELPISRAFHAIDGLCLAATLVGGQFGGRPGWLLTDGSVNVFLLDVGGQTLAVGVSCLDGTGEIFVDGWWPLIDHLGPLMAGDRVFSVSRAVPSARAETPVPPPAGPLSLDASNSEPFEPGRIERRAAKRGDYLCAGLGGRALRVYLQRHTAKRFCKLCTALRRPAGGKGLAMGLGTG